MSSKKPKTILLIDDDEDILVSLSLYLKLHFQKVLTTTAPSTINELLSRQEVDIVLLDMNFQMGTNDGREGLYWLNHIVETRPGLPVILLTAYGRIPLAVEALKRGASDFLVKPWNNSHLLSTINRALESHKGREKKEKTVRSEVTSKGDSESHQLKPQSPKMQNLLQTADKVAATEANILILGENGTGKEVMARYIHEHSLRSKQPFITLDLGSVNENLFEAELFGYKKGAFTDAREDKTGRFEMARGGTLFLDEIGNIPLSLQAKLLTAIQNKTIHPLGGNQSVKIDCRIICATNLDLDKAVQEGTFRQDLMFRINTIQLNLPPLRERKEDIPSLAQHFLKTFNTRYGKDLSLSDEALAEMQKYPWPGNIRELQHIVERSVILADADTIEPETLQLPTGMHHPSNEDEVLDLEEIEKRHISRMLHKFDGNISQTAKALNINRNTLYRKIEKYGL